MGSDVSLFAELASYGQGVLPRRRHMRQSRVGRRALRISLMFARLTDARSVAARRSEGGNHDQSPEDSQSQFKFR